MTEHISRRNFIKATAVTAGTAAFNPFDLTAANNPNQNKLPREVWVGSISQMDLNTETSEEMVDLLLRKMNELIIYSPDVICLPEVFPTSNTTSAYSFSEKVQLSEAALSKMAKFSKEYSCYTICPVYTQQSGKVYNSAVILNRNGEQSGVYNKIHLTEGEIKSGLSPGTKKPPVFKTDFGIIGVQICFDILWDDGWKELKRQGAEMVFFPSAFSGGRMVNAKAWDNKYVVVSSTRKNTSKICDISGMEIEKTGIWRSNSICTSVNLEKAFLHLWPYVRRFPEIEKKYGRDIRITIFHEEEWAIIESLSYNIRVKDILTEFDLRTHDEHVTDATMAQEKARG